MFKPLKYVKKKKKYQLKGEVIIQQKSIFF